MDHGDKLPVVFMVEDVEDNIFLTGECLAGRATLVAAVTLEEAEEYLHRLDCFAAVALDGCVPGNVLNTLPLVRRIRRSFRRPLIATSSRADYRRKMLHAGCTHACDKFEIAPLLFELLGSASE